MSECTACQRTCKYDGLCRGCEARTRSDLATILDAWQETTEPSWPAPSKDNAAGRAKTNPLPGGTDRINWRHDPGLSVLLAWADDWAAIANLTGPSPRTLGAVVAWMDAQLDDMGRRHPEVATMLVEIRQQAWRARGVAYGHDRKPRPTQCECGNEIEPGEPDCDSCGAVVMEMAVQRDVWTDEATTAVAVGVGTSTLRRWARAGQVERAQGRYRLSTVVARVEWTEPPHEQ